MWKCAFIGVVALVAIEGCQKSFGGFAASPPAADPIVGVGVVPIDLKEVAKKELRQVGVWHWTVLIDLGTAEFFTPAHEAAAARRYFEKYNGLISKRKYEAHLRWLSKVRVGHRQRSGSQ
jgi:hypothetical protein